MSMKLLRLGAALMAVGCMGSGTVAAPVVPGFERFGRTGSDPAAVVESGLLLLGELGCVNCHATGKEQAVHLLPKRGPNLDKVGERVRPEWLVAYLKSPHAVKPGTTMPHVLADRTDADRERTATAIAHFLAATGAFDDGPLPDAAKANAAEGLKLYERVGCAVCHGSRANGATPLPDQMQLVDLDKKWSPRALDEFLKNPFHLRPSSRMPALPLKDQERRHVVAGLLGASPPARDGHRGHISFNGRAWLVTVEKLPAIDSLGPPAKTGPVKGLDVIQLAGRSDGFVVQLDGFLHAPSAGTYQFYLSSDDGSRLLIDDRQVVENDGIHPATECHAEIVLEAGVHPIRIEYFEAAGEESLSLDVAPPRQPRRPAVEYVTPAAADKPLASMDVANSAASFAVEPALVEEGRAAFAAVGCASCHELNNADGKRIESAAKPKPLADLMASDGGCLATAPRKGVPHYSLDDAQRSAVTAAIGWLRSPAAESGPAREGTIDRMLTALNCSACHTRDGRGGTIPAVAATDEDGEPILKDVARDVLFTSAVQELGDEGRLPPTLTGVGDKLTAEFLREVLVEGGKDRGAYMQTLMPKWHAPVVEPLAKLLAEDAKTPVPVPDLAGHVAVEIEEQGRELVGSRALGCIKCHSFAGEKGQGVGLIDLVRMPKRLRHEWFLAYVANPQQFRPGTRMPAAWPEGKTFYPDVLDGTAAGQIEGVWRYLSAAKPRPPIGASANPIELVPGDRPIIYRNFIEGAGARAIAVGFPDKVHVAWDAEALRLALVWRGSFIDAGRHWTGRGQGFQPPLGDGVFTPDDAAAIAVLAGADASWPAASGGQPVDPRQDRPRFRGYSLDPQGRPTFNWSTDGMRISEKIEPAGAGDKQIVRRTIRLAGRPPAGEAFFRVAQAPTVEDAGDGWLRIDGRWRVRVSGAGIGPAANRTADGKTEVRRPIAWGPEDTAEFVEELAW